MNDHPEVAAWMGVISAFARLEDFLAACLASEVRDSQLTHAEQVNLDAILGLASLHRSVQSIVSAAQNDSAEAMEAPEPATAALWGRAELE